LTQPKSELFLNYVCDFEAPEKLKAQPGAKAISSAAFMVKNAFRKTQILPGSRFKDYR
jgi:hypothetical protein